MKIMPPKDMKARSRAAGFTIIEVIAVLIVLGIITAVAVSRLTSAATYTLTAETDILKNHLRFAQIRAMNDEVVWGIHFPTATSYVLQKNRAPAPISLPNDSSNTHSFPGGSYNTESPQVTFNNWGIPVDHNGLALTANITITLNQGGASQTVTVTKNTGFIP